MARCPMCRQTVVEGAAALPFCSERCRLLNLGNWLDERYIVPAGDDTSAPSSTGSRDASDEPPEHGKHAASRRRLDD